MEKIKIVENPYCPPGCAYIVSERHFEALIDTVVLAVSERGVETLSGVVKEAVEKMVAAGEKPFAIIHNAAPGVA